jgi:hypothetical protein
MVWNMQSTNLSKNRKELLKAKEHAEESDRLKSAFSQHEPRDTHNEWYSRVRRFY